MKIICSGRVIDIPINDDTKMWTDEAAMRLVKESVLNQLRPISDMLSVKKPYEVKMWVDAVIKAIEEDGQ